MVAEGGAPPTVRIIDELGLAGAVRGDGVDLEVLVRALSGPVDDAAAVRPDGGGRSVLLYVNLGARVLGARGSACRPAGGTARRRSPAAPSKDRRSRLGRAAGLSIASRADSDR